MHSPLVVVTVGVGHELVVIALEAMCCDLEAPR